MDMETYYRVKAELLALNAASDNPRPVCQRCHSVILEADRDEFFPARCACCGTRRLEKIIRRIVRRLGRRGMLRALRALAD